jgi:hypothetical protein
MIGERASVALVMVCALAVSGCGDDGGGTGSTTTGSGGSGGGGGAGGGAAFPFDKVGAVDVVLVNTTDAAISLLEPDEGAEAVSVPPLGGVVERMSVFADCMSASTCAAFTVGEAQIFVEAPVDGRIVFAFTSAAGDGLLADRGMVPNLGAGEAGLIYEGPTSFGVLDAEGGFVAFADEGPTVPAPSNIVQDEGGAAPTPIATAVFEEGIAYLVFGQELPDRPSVLVCDLDSPSPASRCVDYPGP